jgi:hypothetical protein
MTSQSAQRRSFLVAFFVFREDGDAPLSASGPSRHIALAHGLGRYSGKADVALRRITPLGLWVHGLVRKVSLTYALRHKPTNSRSGRIPFFADNAGRLRPKS